MSRLVLYLLIVALLGITGCGTTKSQTATEQLLLSDAVDRSISGIDFRALAGQTVYLDTTYLRSVKGAGFVNADYIVSSLRQQLFAANCLLQDSREVADYIVEPRVGTLGANSHDVTYGMPANNLLSVASTLVANTPTVPTIPELSLMKRNDQTGAAKVAVFAYHRETKQPVWQSGVALAQSSAKNVWFFGAGPFQRGTIYEGTSFAGAEIKIPLLSGEDDGRVVASPVDYFSEVNFEQRRSLSNLNEDLRPANFEEPSGTQDNQKDPKASARVTDEDEPDADMQPIPLKEPMPGAGR